jgi:hypothetical protein
MASPKRFERLTYSLEGCCSIQLSYGDNTYNIARLSGWFKRLYFFKDV